MEYKIYCSVIVSIDFVLSTHTHTHHILSRVWRTERGEKTKQPLVQRTPAGVGTVAGYRGELVKDPSRAAFPRTQLSSVVRGYRVWETSPEALGAAGALPGHSGSSPRGQHRHTKSSNRFQAKGSVTRELRSFTAHHHSQSCPLSNYAFQL